MRSLAPEALQALLEASDLFSDLLQPPAGENLRPLLLKEPAWSLEPGESPSTEGWRGCLVVLDGALGDGDPPGENEGTPTSRRIYCQWRGMGLDHPDDTRLLTGLRAQTTTVILDLSPELVERIVGRGGGGTFQVEYFAPLAAALPDLSDIAPEALEKALRGSRFPRFVSGQAVTTRGQYGGTLFFVLAGALEVEVESGSRPALTAGQFFGEMAVLSYQPRTATIRATAPSVLMECDRVAVAVLRGKSKQFQQHVESRYRSLALPDLLRRTEFFQGMEETELAEVVQMAQLRNFEPYEPVFFQGDRADALYIVLNGTMTVVQETEQGPLPIAWVEDGGTLGEMALLPELGQGELRGQTVTALQRVDAVRIPAGPFRELLDRYPTARQRLLETGRLRQEMNQKVAGLPDRAERLAWMLETQHVAGDAVLAVDMADCIRCNNCVTACQSVHPDGYSRFHWSNLRQHEGVMPQVRFSNSCQHCEYALCAEVCPPQCITRNPVTGAVYIEYDRCIRCGKCADPSQGCPYGSIQIQPAEAPAESTIGNWFSRLFGKQTPHQPTAPGKSGKNYPVKCDLCEGLPYEACVHHCPTGAVFRVDGDLQFGVQLDRRRGGRPAPSAPPLELRVVLAWKEPPVIGKPAELRLRIFELANRTQDEPGAVRLVGRRPETGVDWLTLNFQLVAPPDTRSKGGVMQQLRVPTRNLSGHLEYTITLGKSGGPLSLAAYQGGLFLGRVPIPVEATP